MKIYIFSGLGILVTLVLVFFFFSLNKNNNDKPRNEQIMYGYRSYDEYVANRSEYIKKIDDEFVNSMNSGRVKNKSGVAKIVCDRGSDYAQQGDIKTAIKRFNQAWLLDQDNPCVYANYGYYYFFVEGNTEKAFEIYEKALGLSDQKNSWWILTDYALVLNHCYKDDNKRIDCLDKALSNLTKSLAILDAPKTHRVLALVYYSKREYEKSWNQVHLAIDGGFSKEIMVVFIEDLKKEMPDPRGKY